MANFFDLLELAFEFLQFINLLGVLIFLDAVLKSLPLDIIVLWNKRENTFHFVELSDFEVSFEIVQHFP